MPMTSSPQESLSLPSAVSQGLATLQGSDSLSTVEVSSPDGDEELLSLDQEPFLDDLNEDVTLSSPLSPDDRGVMPDTSCDNTVKQYFLMQPATAAMSHSKPLASSGVLPEVVVGRPDSPNPVQAGSSDLCFTRSRCYQSGTGYTAGCRLSLPRQHADREYADDEIPVRRHNEHHPDDGWMPESYERYSVFNLHADNSRVQERDPCHHAVGDTLAVVQRQPARDADHPSGLLTSHESRVVVEHQDKPSSGPTQGCCTFDCDLEGDVVEVFDSELVQRQQARLPDGASSDGWRPLTSEMLLATSFGCCIEGRSAASEENGEVFRNDVTGGSDGSDKWFRHCGAEGQQVIPRPCYTQSGGLPTVQCHQVQHGHGIGNDQYTPQRQNVRGNVQQSVRPRRDHLSTLNSPAEPVRCPSAEQCVREQVSKVRQQHLPHDGMPHDGMPHQEHIQAQQINLQQSQKDGGFCRHSERHCVQQPDNCHQNKCTQSISIHRENQRSDFVRMGRVNHVKKTHVSDNQRSIHQNVTRLPSGREAIQEGQEAIQKGQEASLEEQEASLEEQEAIQEGQEASLEEQEASLDEQEASLKGQVNKQHSSGRMWYTSPHHVQLEHCHQASYGCPVSSRDRLRMDDQPKAEKPGRHEESKRLHRHMLCSEQLDTMVTGGRSQVVTCCSRCHHETCHTQAVHNSKMHCHVTGVQQNGSDIALAQSTPPQCSPYFAQSTDQPDRLHCPANHVSVPCCKQADAGTLCFLHPHSAPVTSQHTHDRSISSTHDADTHKRPEKICNTWKFSKPMPSHASAMPGEDVGKRAFSASVPHLCGCHVMTVPESSPGITCTVGDGVFKAGDLMDVDCGKLSSSLPNGDTDDKVQGFDVSSGGGAINRAFTDELSAVGENRSTPTFERHIPVTSQPSTAPEEIVCSTFHLASNGVHVRRALLPRVTPSVHSGHLAVTTTALSGDGKDAPCGCRTDITSGNSQPCGHQLLNASPAMFSGAEMFPASNVSRLEEKRAVGGGKAGGPLSPRPPSPRPPSPGPPSPRLPSPRPPLSKETFYGVRQHAPDTSVFGFDTMDTVTDFVVKSNSSVVFWRARGRGLPQNKRSGTLLGHARRKKSREPGGFACNCPVPEAWTTEASDAGWKAQDPHNPMMDPWRRRHEGGRDRTVTVTISSDEEEAAPASDHGSTSSACPAFGASKLGVDSEDIFSTPLTRPSSNFGTSRRMKMEDAVGRSADTGCGARTGQKIRPAVPYVDGIFFQPVAVNVGSLHTFGLQVCFLPHSVQFRVMREDGSKDVVEFFVFLSEIVNIGHCLSSTVVPPYMLLRTTAVCGYRLRSQFRMSQLVEGYFDPEISDDRRSVITITIGSIENKDGLLQTLQKYCHLSARPHFLTPLDCDNCLVSSLTTENFDKASDPVKSPLAKENGRRSHLCQPSGDSTVVESPNFCSAAVSSDVADTQTVHRDATEHPAGDHHSGRFPHQDCRSPSLQVGFVGPVLRLFSYPLNGARHAITVTNEDLFCLNEGEFLNDVMLDFYFKYLMCELVSEEVRACSHVFSSFFYKRLTQRTRPHTDVADIATGTLAKRRHNRVSKWTRGVDIFTKDFCFIPINENSHWFLAIMCYPYLTEQKYVTFRPALVEPATTSSLASSTSCPWSPQSGYEHFLGEVFSPAKNETSPFHVGIQQPCILVMDSLMGPSRNNVIRILKEYLQEEWSAKKMCQPGAVERNFLKEVKGCCPKVPQQQNFSDCGIYVLQYAESFYENPIANFSIPMKLEHWFSVDKVERKRGEIRELMMMMSEESAASSDPRR